MQVQITNSNEATVLGQGTAMAATVNFSGALMEMLATVYVYILMAAIREAIQNASDAARRSGLSVSEGVTVILPTRENPVITVIDRGDGMTREFMESTYLSFGSSTKAADDDSAGGLGVGRWAAYGYIREAYITTTHKDELIERTYFQYQGPNGTPQVQLAAEVPGASTFGTQVFFPVKENDMAEAYRAVAWLKEVMQLTMGDSFSVDKPALLPSMLPEWSGLKLDLGTVDAGLAGVCVYPMCGTNLHYSRTGTTEGSLVVLTNQASGVGGLPFHVKAQSDSVFSAGTIIEIPMRMRVPFMPSREEVKYTDEFTALMARINEAAMLAGIAKAGELYDTPGLASKEQLSRFLGTTERWHSYAAAARQNTSWGTRMQAATGGNQWYGRLRLPATALLLANVNKVTISLETTNGVMKSVFTNSGQLCIENTVRLGCAIPLEMRTGAPFVFVYNDLLSGGLTRMRNWKRGKNLISRLVYISSEEPGLAKQIASDLNVFYGGAIEMRPTSALPEVARIVVAGKVLKRGARGTTFAYYCKANCRMESESMTFESESVEPKKVYLVKDGSKFEGFKEDVSLRDLNDSYNRGNLSNLMESAGLSRIYFLTLKQAKTLAEQKKSAVDAGIWELDESEFGEDDESQAAMAMVKALRGWITFEELLKEQLETTMVQDVIHGRAKRKIDSSYELETFCNLVAKKPRLGLVGTKLDKAISPYVDVLTGTKFLEEAIRGTETPWMLRYACLEWVATHLEVAETDSDERKELLATLNSLSGLGKLNYGDVWQKLTAEFPLLTMIRLANGQSETVSEHYMQSLGYMYR